MRLLERQLELQRESFGVDPLSLKGEALADFVRWNVLALTDELHEALREVGGWKPWSSKPVELNEDAYIEELVDCLHFLGNLLLVAGVDDEELELRYLRKRQVNAERQIDGY